LNKTQILAVTRDSKFREELQELFASLEDRVFVPLFAQDNRQGVELARNRSPEIALVEMRENTMPTQAFAREMADISPSTVVVGVFRPGVFSNNVSESQLLIEVLRCGVKDFLHHPLSRDEFQELLQRIDRDSQRTPAKLGAVVPFISNKGGVGKSTLSTNTAVGLARRHPGKVLLIDASLQLGVAASMLDLNPKATLTEAAREQTRLDTTLIQEMAVSHASGLHLLAAPRDAVEAASVSEEVITQVLSLARRSYDYVIVDTFPVFDAISLAILDLSGKAYVVTENVVPTLLGTAKLIELLDKFSFPSDQTDIILNRQQRIAGSLAPADISQRLGREIDWIFPYDRGVIAAANTGRPVAMQSPGMFGFGRRLKQLIDDVEQVRGQWKSRGIAAPQSQSGDVAQQESPIVRAVNGNAPAGHDDETRDEELYR